MNSSGFGNNPFDTCGNSISRHFQAPVLYCGRVIARLRTLSHTEYQVVSVVRMPGGFVTLVGMDLLGLVGTHCHILNHVNYSRKEVQPCCWQSLSGYFVVQHYCSCTTPTVRASKELGHSEYVRKYRYIPTIFVEVSVSLPGRWVILIHSHIRTFRRFLILLHVDTFYYTWKLLGT